MVNEKIFREYDIRGRFTIDFTDADAYRIARCFSKKIRDAGGKTLVVGYDGRHSSPFIEEAVVAAGKSMGLEVTRLGLCATPLVYFAAHTTPFDAAIMITGSHNPADFNGLKFTLLGGPFFGRDIQDLKADVLRDHARYAPIGGLDQPIYDLQDAYVKHILKDYKTHYPASNLKVVWDMGNGAAGPVVSELTKYLPGEHRLLNADVDGSFPAHHPDPLVAANLTQLIDEVRQHGADFGIAFDGDGDRIGVVDDSGEIRWGDQLMMLYAQEVLTSAPGSSIIADVKASQQFFDHVHRLGGIAHLSPSGHSIIKRAMKDMKCLLAGEMSGHIFFADRNFGYDDAIYAAVRLIGICSTLNQSLSAWFNAFSKTFATPEMRLNTEHRDKFQIVNAVKAELRAQHKSFNEIDGIRMTSPEGWWLLRASNTQEELVTRIEGNTESGLRTLHSELESFLKPHGLSINEDDDAA